MDQITEEAERLHSRIDAMVELTNHAIGCVPQGGKYSQAVFLPHRGVFTLM